MSTILITGGSGLIGTALTGSLLADGHSVRHLSRTPGKRHGVQAFAWDIKAGTMDPQALEGVDHIVHLAGAGIADSRWTRSRVQELIDSRSLSALLLLHTAKKTGSRPRSMVSAAGINYYGAVTSQHRFTETDPAGADTIACISLEWEAAVDQWASLCRVVKLRTPVVFAAQGGALTKLSAPVKLGLGAALGSGEQWMPWIHLEDLVKAYRYAIDNEQMHGAYNVCAPEDATNGDVMRTVAKVLERPYFLPPVPGFLMRLALGELAVILLEGSRADTERLKATGFTFTHPTLERTLRDVLKPA